MILVDNTLVKLVLSKSAQIDLSVIALFHHLCAYYRWRTAFGYTPASSVPNLCRKQESILYQVQYLGIYPNI